MEIEVVPGLMGDGWEERSLAREDDVSPAWEGADRGVAAPVDIDIDRIVAVGVSGLVVQRRRLEVGLVVAVPRINRIPLRNPGQIDDLREHIVITAPVLVEDGVGRIDLTLDLRVGIDIARSWPVAIGIEDDLNGDAPLELSLRLRAEQGTQHPRQHGSSPPRDSLDGTALTPTLSLFLRRCGGH